MLKMLGIIIGAAVLGFLLLPILVGSEDRSFIKSGGTYNFSIIDKGNCP